MPKTFLCRMIGRYLFDFSKSDHNSSYHHRFPRIGIIGHPRPRLILTCVVHRRDRATHGGGVACAVRTCPGAERREDLEVTDTEALVVELKTIPVSLLCVAYCPPNDNEVLSRTTSMLQDLCARFPERPIFAVGDFNVPAITWLRDPDLDELRPVTTQTSRWARCLIESVDVAGLKQHVAEPTRVENYLDLICSRSAHVDAAVRKGVLLSDHDEICCQARIQGVGAGARTHPWGGVSPFKMHYSIAFKHQFIIGRPLLGEILYPPLVVISAYKYVGVL